MCARVESQRQSFCRETCGHVAIFFGHSKIPFQSPEFTAHTSRKETKKQGLGATDRCNLTSKVQLVFPYEASLDTGEHGRVCLFTGKWREHEI